MFNRKQYMMGLLGAVAVSVVLTSTAFAQMGGVVNPTAGPGQMVVPTSPIATPAEPPKPRELTEEQKKDLAVAKEVANINQRIALLTAQLAELDLQAQIAEKKADIEKAGEGGDSSNDLGAGRMLNAMPPQIPMSALSMPVDQGGDILSSDMPSVVSIEGIDGDMRAIMSVDGNSGILVRIGEEIDGWSIKNIDIDRVTLKKGKTIRKVYLSGKAERSSVTQRASVMPRSVPSMMASSQPSGASRISGTQ